MITLTQLINVAPFPEPTKQELLKASETFSDTKKFELEEMCWALISQWYQNELISRQEVAALEMANGGTKLTIEEFAKISEDLLFEVVTKLEVESSEKNLEDVRERLKEVTSASN